MTTWTQRSHEERALLNPAFCATLLWHAAQGHVDKSQTGLSFEEAFLVLPIVLHRHTRQSLPRTTRTSLPVWLQENPLARSRIVTRAKLLMPFTKEAMIFGGANRFLQIVHGKLMSEGAYTSAIDTVLRTSSDEVRDCVKRAAFIGAWFARSGSPMAVLATIGVRP